MQRSVLSPNCQNLSDGLPDICGESCPVVHVLLILETVSNSESLATEAYSPFNSVWQPINMAFCTEKVHPRLLFWVQTSRHHILVLTFYLFKTSHLVQHSSTYSEDVCTLFSALP